MRGRDEVKWVIYIVVGRVERRRKKKKKKGTEWHRARDRGCVGLLLLLHPSFQMLVPCVYLFIYLLFIYYFYSELSLCIKKINKNIF